MAAEAANRSPTTTATKAETGQQVNSTNTEAFAPTVAAPEAVAKAAKARPKGAGGGKPGAVGEWTAAVVAYFAENGGWATTTEHHVHPTLAVVAKANGNATTDKDGKRTAKRSGTLFGNAIDRGISRTNHGYTVDAEADVTTLAEVVVRRSVAPLGTTKDGVFSLTPETVVTFTAEARTDAVAKDAKAKATKAAKAKDAAKAATAKAAEAAEAAEGKGATTKAAKAAKAATEAAEEAEVKATEAAEAVAEVTAFAARWATEVTRRAAEAEGTTSA